MKKEKSKKQNIIIWMSHNDYAIYIVITVIVLVCLLLAVLVGAVSINSIIDISVFFAVVLEGTLIASAKYISKLIARKYEDRIKLSDNYNKIANTYNKTKGLIKSDEIIDNKVIMMPVAVDSWLINTDLIIYDNNGTNYHLPEVIVKYYDKLLSAHDNSDNYNNITIRVNDWKVENDLFEIYTGRTSYYNHLVTNRAMDYEFEKGLTVRTLYECGPYIHTLNDSNLANQFGFNGFIESSDGRIIIVKRKDSLSVGKGLWTGSVSGSMKVKYALDDEYRFTKDRLYYTIIKEIEDELAISSDLLEGQMQQEKISLIAAYRDLIEGGKPHILFFAKCKMNYKEINNVLTEKQSRDKRDYKKEVSQRKKKEIENATDANTIDFYEVKQIMNNLKVYNSKLVLEGKTYKTSPSYSACFVMLRKYLNDTYGDL